MTAVKNESHESNSLYIMFYAIAITILLVFSVILGIFAITGSASYGSDTSSSTTEDTGSDQDILRLQELAGNDAEWIDAKTTSIAVLALNKAGIGSEETWMNQNGVEVSIGNEKFSNSLQWLEYYLTQSRWYTDSAVIDVESFSLSLLAYQATGTSTSGLEDAVTALKNAQDPGSGSWNNDIYETALASFVLSKIEGPQDATVRAGVAYLQGQEQDLYFGTVLDSSTAILALYNANFDVTGELKTLVTHQDETGSFGSVEDTSWAVLAIAVDESGNTYSFGEEARVWLAKQSDDTTGELDLAYIVLGTGVDYEAYVGAIGVPPPEDDDTAGNGTFDVDDVPPEGLGTERQEETLDPFEPTIDGGKSFNIPSETDTSPKGDPDELFDNNMLWTIIAIIIVLVIMSLATWGLIARVEEGRALEGVRRDIYEYIKHNPGEHFAGIMHEFDMSPSSTTYHLKVLEDTEQVVAHRDNKYKRYYAAGNTLQLDMQTKNYKELLSALKNVTARKIVWYVLDHQGSNQKDVASALGLHPSTVNWHANRLYQAGIMEKLKSGKEITYSIPNEDSVRSGMTIIEDRT